MNKLKGNNLKNHEEFWRGIFNKDIRKSSFSDKTLYNNKVQYSNIEFMIPKEITNKILLVCNNSSIGIYIYMISAVQYILKVYSGNDDVAIGTEVVTKGKKNNGQHPMVLMFKSSINEEDTFKELLSQSKEMFVNINKFNSIDVQQIQYIAGIEEFDNKTAIIDAIVRLKNINSNEKLKGFDVSTIFEFEFNDNNMFCNIKYNINSISEERIKSLKNYLINFLNQVSNNLNIKLKNINLLKQEEINELIALGEGKKAYLNKEETINDLFENQVKKTPDNIAVIFEDKKLSYKELNEKANSVARILRNKGVKADSIVGIMVERSLEMVIGIMGVLKAGGAYLPIDPNYPKDRVEYILKDSCTKILLIKGDFVENIRFDGDVIDLLQVDLSKYNSENLNNINNSRNLAYIIYTSGTTGNPKGVMIEHRSLVNRLIWMQNKYPLNEEDTILQKTTYTFDVSVWELLWWSLVGAKVCMLSPNDEKDPTKIIETVNKYDITIMHFVPSMLDAFLYCLVENKQAESLTSLRQVFCSGEALNFKQVSKFYKELGNSKTLINLYGPTEAAIDVSYFDTISNSDMKVIPIGKPISNIKLYILDKNNKMQPIGVSGELCITGDGLARGYLNKPELTAEKFVDNPFESGTKMYRTGDLARWLPDGNIEFLGRIDKQVKIRGFRIELGEIESKLLQNEDIEATVTLVREDKENDKYICAYIVSKKEINDLNLKDYLKESLPEYMIPSYFVKLDKMPITSNGKFDIRAFPKPNLERRSTTYEAPRNTIEETLVKIWSEVLGIDKIGINDNFFELGGHSLKAMGLVSRIQKDFNVNILITDILNLMTIEEIGRYINDNKFVQVSYKTLKSVEKREFYPVTSSQKRMFILQSLKSLDTAYNVQLVKVIKGDLDLKKLEESFIGLINRHEALRTYFEFNENEVVQRVEESVSFRLEIIEKNNRNIDSLIVDFVRPFDLGKAPLIRVRIVKCEYSDYIMMLDIHHICTDAITLKVLTNELSLLYNGETLPSIDFQYKDFACWQRALLQTPSIQKQKKYWYNNLSNYDFKRNIFNKCSLNYRNEGRLKRTKFNIGNTLKAQLEDLCHSNQVTVYMILLTAYNILLYRFSEEEDIIIGMPIAGRHHPNLDKIVGVFINTLVIRSFPNSNKTVRELLNEIKETMLNAFRNQDYPFDDIVNDLNIKRSENKNTLFNVLFTLNNINYKELNLLGVEVEEYDIKSSKLMVDLSLDGEILNDELTFVFEYNDIVFNKNLIDKFVYNYIKILRNMINLEIKIGDIELEQF